MRRETMRRTTETRTIALAVATVAVLAVAACAGPGAASPSPARTADPCGLSPLDDPATPFGSKSVRLGPPAATPLPAVPPAPATDGTRATIDTDRGRIVIELYTRSAPVATGNFAGLAEAGFYDGVVFHRLVPGFVIQGGDGEWGRSDRLCEAQVGSGGPGYTIRDEPFAGQYRRGVVAMARTPRPDSQGSQFFIVLDDRAEPALESYRTYVIFGRVVEGMEVVDAIAAMPNSGEPDNRALEPIAMKKVSIERP